MSIQSAAIMNEISRIVISGEDFSHALSFPWHFLLGGRNQCSLRDPSGCVRPSVYAGDGSDLKLRQRSVLTAFVQTDTVIESSFCLAVLMPRKALEPSIWIVNSMWGLLELICDWNSTTCSLFSHTWLSPTYLNHHGLGAVERAFSSTCSMTRLAKMALTGDPIEQPKTVCWKWMLWNTKKLLSSTNCRVTSESSLS